MQNVLNSIWGVTFSLGGFEHIELHVLMFMLVQAYVSYPAC